MNDILAYTIIGSLRGGPLPITDLIDMFGRPASDPEGEMIRVAVSALVEDGQADGTMRVKSSLFEY